MGGYIRNCAALVLASSHLQGKVTLNQDASTNMKGLHNEKLVGLWELAKSGVTKSRQAWNLWSLDRRLMHMVATDLRLSKLLSSVQLDKELT